MAQDLLDHLQRLASYGTLDDPILACRLSAGLESTLRRWETESLPFIAAGGAELRFVEGAYGRGKTHFLLTLQTAALRNGFVTCTIQCGMQQKPFSSLRETYRVVASNLRPPAPNTDGESLGLAPLLARLSPEQTRAFYEAGRGNPGFRNLVDAYIKRIQSGCYRDNLTTDLHALLHADPNRRVTFGELFRQSRSLPRPLGRLGKRNAGVWLRSLLSLPRHLGFKGLVVLFDETGSDLHLRPESLRVRQEHMANLRNLVDHLATGRVQGCSIVYASTKDLIQLARDDYPALAQRIERLDGLSPFGSLTRNPRAVWCRLDELTDPAPDTPDFFLQLGANLLTLAADAGIASNKLELVRSRLPVNAKSSSENHTQSAVRDFIKKIASQILCPT